MKCLMLVVVLIFGDVLTAQSEMWITATRIPNEIRDGRLRNAVLSLSFSRTRTWETTCADSCWDDCVTQLGCQSDCLADSFDHLVIRSLDGVSGQGRAIAHSEFSDDNSDGHIGKWSWSQQCQCQVNPDCPGGIHYRQNWTYAEQGEATVYLTLPCGSWRIYYLMTRRDWDVLCVDSNNTWPIWGGTSVRVMKDLGGDSLGSCFWDPNLADFASSLPPGLCDSADIYMDDCNEPPPGDAELRFVGYVRPGGGEGNEWLPAPGDSIGLAFSVSSASGRKYRLQYYIGDLSMWKGQCLNSPRFAPNP